MNFMSVATIFMLHGCNVLIFIIQYNNVATVFLIPSITFFNNWPILRSTVCGPRVHLEQFEFIL